ncbi:hypothetical protein HFX86_001188 [Enterococcus faecalis]|uniref:hypothetical protein n=1 Tax=Enterococcus faecalis TaxID=1351 RepID=UPI00115F0790|nr:hypothetical protein [Enterococcus faecalis]EGO5829452.1 hypothetical protein [Enterococcus faecalis]EGO6035008.1 hypothetical protein [Enterococcus faecalis]
MNKITINKMVSKKLMGARKLHCLGVLFLAVTLSGSAERLQAAVVSKEGHPLIRKNIVTEKSEYLVEANQSIWELAQDAQKPLNQFMKENQLRSSYIKKGTQLVK